MNIQGIKAVDGTEETVLQADNCTINLNLGVTQSEAQAMIDYLLNIKKTTQYHALYPSALTLNTVFSDYYEKAPLLLSMICHDKMGGNVPMTFSENRHLIGACESRIAYSGDSTTRGTYNINESTVTTLENGYNVHLVYDFPTHAGNGAIKRICFYPTLFYTDNASTRGAYYYPSLVNQLSLSTKITKPLFTYSTTDYNIGLYYSSYTALGTAIVGDNGQIVAKVIDETSLMYYNPTTEKTTITDLSSIVGSSLYKNHISYFDGDFWYPSTNGYFNSYNGTTGNITMYNLEFDENGTCKKGSKTKVLDGLSTKSGYTNNTLASIIECPTCYVVVMGCNNYSTTGKTYTVLLIYDKSWIFQSKKQLSGTYQYLSATSYYYDETTRELYLSVNGTTSGGACSHCVVDELYTVTENSTYNVDCMFSHSPNGEYMASFTWSTMHHNSSNTYQYPYAGGLDGIIGYSEFKKPLIDIVLEEPLNKTNAETLKLIFDFEITTE